MRTELEIIEKKVPDELIMKSRMEKAKILEKVGQCWNDVNESPGGASHIQPDNKITIYKLNIQEKPRSEIANWNEVVNDYSNIIIFNRGNETEMMCQNENIRDAIDDVCEIISQWYSHFLYHYNVILYEDNRVNTIKELMNRSVDLNTRGRIERVCEFLGGITFNELIAIGCYKLRRNERVHKMKWSMQDNALNRLDIASIKMPNDCKQAINKCIKIVYRT
ncbi:hypothetical protein RhiirA4_427748 [Rhizophagus irregularis]|uniref:Uncharacterized protein n=1 Tax=Rhizophagus irregularis TaxID=588596 RepID=A0A2I1HA51_9GLOM|nr:hypothetical protein RhiirA4_427748 [Rhizophagus irregularis]